MQTYPMSRLGRECGETNGGREMDASVVWRGLQWSGSAPSIIGITQGPVTARFRSRPPAAPRDNSLNSLATSDCYESSPD